MPNNKQALKRAHQADRRRTHNGSVKSALRTEIKRLRKLVTDGNKAGAEAQQRVIESRADKAAKRRIIHPRTASRIKSRVKTRVSALA